MKTKNSRYLPTEEDPRYGGCFQITGIQFQTIDREFTDWELLNYPDERIIPIGKNREEWRKIKNQISDYFTLFRNSTVTDGSICKDVSSLRVHYLGDKKGVEHVLWIL